MHKQMSNNTDFNFPYNLIQFNKMSYYKKKHNKVQMLPTRQQIRNMTSSFVACGYSH